MSCCTEHSHTALYTLGTPCRHLSSRMLHVWILYSPSRKLFTATSGSLGGCGRRRACSLHPDKLNFSPVLTSCVSLQHWNCLTSYRYSSLTLSLTLSLHACFSRNCLPCTLSLDARLYLWYQDLWIVELLSAHQHIAPTPLRYLHWSLC